MIKQYCYDSLLLFYNALFRPNHLQQQLNSWLPPKKEGQNTSWEILLVPTNRSTWRVWLLCLPWWLLGGGLLLSRGYLFLSPTTIFALIVILALVGWGMMLYDQPSWSLSWPSFLAVGLTATPILWPTIQTTLIELGQQLPWAMVTVGLLAYLGGNTTGPAISYWVVKQKYSPRQRLLIALPVALSGTVAGGALFASSLSYWIVPTFVVGFVVVGGVVGGVVGSVDETKMQTDSIKEAKDVAFLVAFIVAGGMAFVVVFVVVGGVAFVAADGVAFVVVGIVADGVTFVVASAIIGILTFAMVIGVVVVVVIGVGETKMQVDSIKEAGNVAFVVAFVVLFVVVGGMAFAVAGVVVGGIVGGLFLPASTAWQIGFLVALIIGQGQPRWRPTLIIMGIVAALRIEQAGWLDGLIMVVVIGLGYTRFPIQGAAWLWGHWTWWWVVLNEPQRFENSSILPAINRFIPATTAQARLPSLPPFVDETVWLKVPHLDKLLVQATRENRSAGLQAVATVAQSRHQSWAAQPAYVQITADILANCSQIEHIPITIDQVTWLPEDVKPFGPDIALVWPRLIVISQDIKSALDSDSPYSCKLGLDTARKNLNRLQDSLIPLGHVAVNRWQPVITQWLTLVGRG